MSGPAWLRPGRRIAALVAAAMVGLSGCAVQPVVPAAAPADRVAVHAFEMEGRLSATDGERAANGRLLWSHAPATDEWTVLSPLGQVVAQLVSTPSGAQLRTADGRLLEAADAEAVLPQVLGVSAPLDGLAHWVQAAPRPGARVLDLDATGRPARIADSGWLIDYPEYAGDGPDAPPRRIDAHWGDARIRLVIDQWEPRE